MERQEGQEAMLDHWVREAESKQRIKQMKVMTKLEVGFNDIEHFLVKLEDRTYGRGDRAELRGK